MTMDRREFVTTGLAAVAAAATPLAQGKRADGAGTVEVFFKGQFVYITEGGMLHVSRVRAPNHPHNGYIFVRQSPVVRGANAAAITPEIEVDDKEGNWHGWAFEGQISLLQDGKPIPAPAAVKLSEVSRGGGVPYPLDLDEAWNDRVYIPQLGTIAPNCEVKDDWRTECLGVFSLSSAKLRPRKPCKAEDIVSVWGWRAAGQGQQPGQLTHVGAVTDLVSYPTMSFAPNTTLTLQFAALGNRERQPQAALRTIPIVVTPGTRILALNAPDKPGASAQKAHSRGVSAEHFDNVYKVLKQGKFPKMEYVTQSAPVGSVKPNDCDPPYGTKFFGDDIFCPGGEPPPKP